MVYKGSCCVIQRARFGRFSMSTTWTSVARFRVKGYASMMGWRLLLSREGGRNLVYSPVRKLKWECHFAAGWASTWPWDGGRYTGRSSVNSLNLFALFTADLRALDASIRDAGAVSWESGWGFAKEQLHYTRLAIAAGARDIVSRYFCSDPDPQSIFRRT